MQLPVVWTTAQFQRQGETEIRDEWKRVGRIYGERCQHRKDAIQKYGLCRGPVGGRGDVLGVQQAQAHGREFAAEFQPQALLIVYQVVGFSVHLAKLLAGGQPVLAQHPHALAHLPFQTGHPDHVKFVEVVGRNRQEPQSLK